MSLEVNVHSTTAMLAALNLALAAPLAAQFGECGDAGDHSISDCAQWEMDDECHWWSSNESEVDRGSDSHTVHPVYWWMQIGNNSVSEEHGTPCSGAGGSLSGSGDFAVAVEQGDAQAVIAMIDRTHVWIEYNRERHALQLLGSCADGQSYVLDQVIVPEEGRDHLIAKVLPTSSTSMYRADQTGRYGAGKH